MQSLLSEKLEITRYKRVYDKLYFASPLLYFYESCRKPAKKLHPEDAKFSRGKVKSRKYPAERNSVI